MPANAAETTTPPREDSITARRGKTYIEKMAKRLVGTPREPMALGQNLQQALAEASHEFHTVNGGKTADERFADMFIGGFVNNGNTGGPAGNNAGWRSNTAGTYPFSSPKPPANGPAPVTTTTTAATGSVWKSMPTVPPVEQMRVKVRGILLGDQQQRAVNSDSRKLLVVGDTKSGKDFVIMCRVMANKYSRPLVILPNREAALRFVEHLDEFFSEYVGIRLQITENDTGDNNYYSCDLRVKNMQEPDRVFRVCTSNYSEQYLQYSWDTIIVNEPDLCNNTSELVRNLGQMCDDDGYIDPDDIPQVTLVGTQFPDGLLSKIMQFSPVGEWSVIKLPWYENTHGYEHLEHFILEIRDTAPKLLNEVLKIGSGWPITDTKRLLKLAPDPWHHTKLTEFLFDKLSLKRAGYTQEDEDKKKKEKKDK